MKKEENELFGVVVLLKYGEYRYREHKKYSYDDSTSNFFQASTRHENQTIFTSKFEVSHTIPTSK